MSVKLNLTKKDEPQWSHEHEFEKEIITIGRDSINDLKLVSTKSAVSRKHAKLIRDGDSYKLVDLNSRNFTFLNNKKLNPGVEYNLKNGDQFNICDFVIHFSAGGEKREPVEKKVFDAEKTNPYIKDSQALGEILKRICNEYECDEPSRRDKVFKETLHESLDNLKLNKSTKIIVSVLHTQQDTSSFPPDESDLNWHAIPSFDQKQGVIDILLKFLVKLIQARRQFLMDFISETLVKSKESFSIHNCSDEELKKYLFGPNISSNELQKRIEQIKCIADEIMLHQISMLEGYKGSVNEGTKQILNKINPDIFKKQIAERKSVLGRVRILYRYLPILSVFKLLKLLSNAYREISLEDQSIIEKKYFRPGFIKSYIKQMNSARK